MLYFVKHGVSTSAKSEKNGYLIRMRESTADYIPKGLPQLIVTVKRVRKGEFRHEHVDISFSCPDYQEQKPTPKGFA